MDSVGIVIAYHSPSDVSAQMMAGIIDALAAGAAADLFHTVRSTR
jgi:hypothetical protein